MKAKLITFVTLAILLMTCATPAYGQELPPLPHAFYGTVEINDSPAPIGTQVEAKGEEVLTGIEGNPVVTTTAGSYGSPDPMGPKLIVQGDILDGATITFYVNGVSTEQTTEWHSGDVTELNLSATIAVPPPGGGGGGGAPPPTLPPGTISLIGLINYHGVFTQNVIGLSSDGLLRLIIAENTVGLTWYGAPLAEITMTSMEAPPAPPEHAHIIGLVYDLQPDRATFNPPATLEYTYDPTNIPEGIAEQDLVLAWWDAKASRWVELESTVDSGANTITAPISHFTAFATLAYEPPEPMPKPAAFSISSLIISPSEIVPGKSVVISIEVTNTGGEAGSYKVTLKIDGMVEATKEITVNAGASQEVTFTTKQDLIGTYSVDVNGLSGTFVVREEAPPAPPPSPPSAPVNWPLIWGIIGGVVILGIIIFLAARKRKA